MGATVVAAVGGAGLIAASTATIGAIATAAVSTAVVGAVVGGITAVVTGGDIGAGILKGAIIGGLTGAAAGVLGIGGTSAAALSEGQAVTSATSLGASESAAAGAKQAATMAAGQGGAESTAGLLAGDYTKGMLVKSGVDAVSGMAQGYAKADAAKEQQDYDAEQKKVNWNTGAAPLAGLIQKRTAAANMTTPADQSMSYRVFQGDSLAIETPKIEAPKIAPLTLNQQPA